MLIRTPAREGPTIRVAFWPAEFIAIAFAIRSRGTTPGTMACRVGAMNAMTAPPRIERTMTCQG
ncbi:MAG: hypothetical protein R2849_17175 [Thermomicrobiales bacterium]